KNLSSSYGVNHRPFNNTTVCDSGIGNPSHNKEEIKIKDEVDSTLKYYNATGEIKPIKLKESNLMFSLAGKKLSPFNAGNSSDFNNSSLESSILMRKPSRNKTAKAIEKLLNLAYPLDDCDAEELTYRKAVLSDIEPYRRKKNPDKVGTELLNKIKASLEETLQEDGIKYDAKFKLVS
ncbi:MAG: hypothetical protein COB50_02425, partial [Thiotrichales bacterium]